MTEPSTDDVHLREWFWRCALNLQNAAIKSTPQIAHPCDADHFADDAMRRIDALTEQRVAAAVQEERERIAEAVRNSARATLDDLADEILKSADRPAPDGTASVHYEFCPHDKCERTDCYSRCMDDPRDLAGPRCSTPSQEDTGSVSGTMPDWVGQKDPDGCLIACLAMVACKQYEDVVRDLCQPLKTGGLTYLVALEWLNRHSFVYQHFYKYNQLAREQRVLWPLPPWAPIHICGVDAGRGGGSSHGVVMLADGTVLDPITPENKRLSDYVDCGYMIGIWPSPPTDAAGPASASNTDAAQESFQCPSCHWHHGHDPAEWFTEEAKLRGFLELVKRERVPFVVNEEVAESSPTQAVAPPGPTAGDVERARSIVDDAANIVGGPEALREMLCKDIAVALSAVHAEARAELLAQIKGPTLHRAVAQLMAENLGHDPKRNWRGTISDKDFPQLVDDICDAIADKLEEAK